VISRKVHPVRPPWKLLFLKQALSGSQKKVTMLDSIALILVRMDLKEMKSNNKQIGNAFNKKASTPRPSSEKASA